MNNQQLLTTSIATLETDTVTMKRIVKAYEANKLLTFAEWKKLGYSVKKGEKAIFSCPLWKKATKKDDETVLETDENGNVKTRFFMKNCHFFIPSQVELIKTKNEKVS